MNREVVIVQRRLTHYRVPLFDRMRQLLGECGIRLRLLHGIPTAYEQTKLDGGSLHWAEELATRYWLGGRVMWQPFMHLAAGADLVIVTQENKHLHNIPAILNPYRVPKIAFWGHGRNMQAAGSGAAKEAFKRWLTRRVDWWFAYTEMSKGFVEQTGYPGARITVLNNSVDTSALRNEFEIVSIHGREAARAALGLRPGIVACFIGSLYTDKHLPLLLDAADRLHSELPEFQLAVAGAGPLQGWIQSESASRPYLTYLGPVHGARKAQLLLAADIMLNPGLVGLGILDAFVAGVPILTTDCSIHSPEIAYLQNGTNGIMTPPDVDSFVGAVLKLLGDASAMARIREGARRSAKTFSIDEMSVRFCEGIKSALQTGPI